MLYIINRYSEIFISSQPQYNEDALIFSYHVITMEEEAKKCEYCMLHLMCHHVFVYGPIS